MNAKKTKAVWIGNMSNSMRRLCADVKLNWTREPFKILGIVFTSNLQGMGDLNYTGIISKMKNMLHIWRRRHLASLGRIPIVKTLVISKRTYLIINKPRPPDNY